MITLNRWVDIAIKDRRYIDLSMYDLETELTKEIAKLFSGDERYRASMIFNHNLPPDYNSFRIDLNLLLNIGSFKAIIESCNMKNESCS
jgi:hypothetical protein